MRTRFLAALMVVLFTNGIIFAQEPIPDDQVSVNPYCQDYCICIVEELLALPSGFSFYLGEHHESHCVQGMDCSDPTPVFMALESGIPPDDCEANGCFYGTYPSTENRLNKPLPAIIAKKVPHDFQPKFSPTYKGDIEIIHSEVISFVADGQQRRAKTFLVKIQPTEVSAKNPVRVVGLGFEVEDNPETKPVLSITNEKDIERLYHSIYQVNIRGMIYGVATTDAPGTRVASLPSKSPTLAAKE